jgi:DNA-binding GntR family transcriptional regulator
MPVPNVDDPRPPNQQIADDLRRQIAEGKYHVEDRLPSNKAMAAQYHTSTETIRRALRILTDEHLVRAHSTLGTFVLRSQGKRTATSGYADVEAAIQASEARLHGEIAELREDVERLQVQMMAVFDKQGITYSHDENAREAGR